ncbi:MAG TPA: hypothetical protein VLX61_01555 [Anaerolineales bacterium]|nr:hypothetical protein [Anaerolineales bacterium]
MPRKSRVRDSNGPDNQGGIQWAQYVWVPIVIAIIGVISTFIQYGLPLIARPSTATPAGTVQPTPTMVATVSPTSTATPPVIPTFTNTPTPSPTPTPTDQQLIVSVLRTYFWNIPNYEFDNISRDRAWSMLAPSLQGLFGDDEESWWDNIAAHKYFVALDNASDLYQNIFIDKQKLDAKADIVWEARDKDTDALSSGPRTITICFIRIDGQWLIRHINNKVITLNNCMSF